MKKTLLPCQCCPADPVPHFALWHPLVLVLPLSHSVSRKKSRAGDAGVNPIQHSAGAKFVSDSLLFRKEAAWKGKGKGKKERERGLLYSHRYFICTVYTMENKSQGTLSQIISVSLMVWKWFCFYRGKTNVNLMCVCASAHAAPLIAKGRAAKSRNKK